MGRIASLGWLVGVVAAAGCQCTVPVSPSTRYACATDADCAEGYRCLPADAGLQCLQVDGGAGGGSTGGGDAGGGNTGGGNGGGGNGGGGDAGGLGGGGGGSPMPTPVKLAFATPPRSAYVSACSGALTLQTRDSNDQVAAVLADTALTLELAPPGLGFFSDAACTTAATSVSIATGSSEKTFFFRSPTAGTFTVTVSATDLTPASQVATVVASPTSLVFTSSPPGAPLLAGRCFPATIEARVAAAPTPVAEDTPVALTVNPTDASRFYSNVTCANAITGTTLPAGQSSATFYVKPLSQGLSAITASAPFGSANQSFTAVGVVRRGTCSMAGQSTMADGGIINGDTYVGCSVNPPHQSTSSTLLLYQTSFPSGAAGAGAVRCRLNSVGQVQCRRNSDSGPANIAWQTAELPTGLQVQRLSDSPCPDSGTVIPLDGGLDPASTLVTSSFSTGGGTFDDEDLSVATLLSSTELLMETDVAGAGVCDGYEVQLAQLSGLSVTRGGADAGLDVGATTATVSGLPAATTNTALLTQARTAVASPVTPDPHSICNLLVRGQVASPTSVSFTRGGGVNDGGCAEDVMTGLPFQRLDFGARARVQVVPVTLSSSTTNVSIASVDVSRTVVFASGQLAGGQGTGETTFNGPASLYVGTGAATFELTTATNVRVTRGRNSGVGLFTLYVVELDP